FCYLVFCLSDCLYFFFFSSRRRHTRCYRDWSSDVCSSDLDPKMDGNVPDGLRNVSIDSFEFFPRSVLSRGELLSEGANLRSDFRPAGLERAVPLANLLPVTERACGKQRLLRLIAGLSGRGVADFPAVHSAPVLLHGLVREFRVCTKRSEEHTSELQSR